MILNFLKVSFRSLFRQKLYTTINILGLTGGITCSLLITLYVLNELSFDRFHKYSDRIYRITLAGRLGTSKFNGPVASSPMASFLVKEFPEVESAVRIFPMGNRCVQYENKLFYEDRFAFADSNFFDLFNFKFILGNSTNALRKPGSVVITKSMALKYFGTENSIGKYLEITNDDIPSLEITGIIEDMPQNSHFHFDFIASSKVLKDANNPYWINSNNYTYILLKQGSSPQNVENKFPDLVRRFVVPQVIEFYKAKKDSIFTSYFEYKFHLQKLTQIHLHSNLGYELEPNGNIKYIYLFITVALFVLLIACINFINLATAYSINRAKEVGIRKVLGASKRNIILQFLAETIILCFMAVIASIFLSELLIPVFNKILSLQLDINILERPIALLIIIIITFMAGLIAGIYPSIFMASYVPIEVIKGLVNKKSSKVRIKNVLVVFQFSISIFIILGTITLYDQLKFLQHKNLGFEKDQLLVIERTDPIKKNVKEFMRDLKKAPFIRGVSLSTSVPGRTYSTSAFTLDNSSNNRAYFLSYVYVDYDFLNTTGTKIITGRFFSKNHLSDTNAILLNETAVKYLSLQNPIGHQLIAPTPDPKKSINLNIIGVINDFHYESLHNNVRPLFVALSTNYYDGYITLRISSEENHETLNYISSFWYKYNKKAPLVYFYLNNELSKLYSSEYKLRQIMSLFSFLSIFIACMGLFGLIAYVTEKRTKEIGIRKAMGSSVFRIIQMLSKDVVFLVLIASVIAIPCAWYFMFLWLKDFAYQVKLSLLMFVLVCFSSIILALLTIIIQAYKAAKRNPVESLRYE